MFKSLKQKEVKQLVVHSKSFGYEIQKLSDVTKERHYIFIDQVKKMKDSVDLKVPKLKSEMAKYFEKMEKNCTLLHNKVDVVTNAIKKLVNFNTDS